MTTVKATIEKKLMESFKPAHLEVINESYMHNVPKGSETHFKVVVVSDKFNEVKHIDRHRLVNKILSKELEGPVHALSVKAKTPAQWSKSQKVDPSPSCRGGSKHDPHFNK
uniref:BolA-like protein n=1 Tax=Lotharella globosa TaxID=91324 RepID=A0A6U3DVW8_9EUKA|eukprot:CAMPEP_0167794526 /NCGR_PEP_ID=MMETSP0111_2-20121227/13851_1 /TAXON_ID=91324 /ORGANISM="Lotharella globosa, Strain CCCM811" /LENGTH=110 /DNA_ID=CAMNT_0007687937 /DNA_START=14 /DNA_END=346 /DNA_ORIENTATION=-